MSEVTEFYDRFLMRQVRAGINHRHLSILCQLKNLGLKKTDHVLEVGCGIGTVSELILREISANGSFYGVDISPQSIRLASRLMTKYKNAQFDVRDFTVSESLDRKFNIIVLPDVIEHIPLDSHPYFFSNLYKMLEDSGSIFIHIPHPNYLEWLIDTGSKDLQIVDQPVYTDKLTRIVYSVGFYIHYLSSYSIYVSNCDYQVIILKKKLPQDYQGLRRPFKPQLWTRIRLKIRYVLRGFR